MEENALLLTALNKELTESKAILQNLANEIRAVQDIVGPALMAHAQQLRSARMTVVSELQTSLVALREVRKFFLESDYADEMDRLERFVRVCKEVQVLKQSGVFDAVVDSAIRLAVQEVSNNEHRTEKEGSAKTAGPKT